MKRQHDRIRSMAQSAMIAALYVALTFVANMAGLANGAVQLRLSEALTVLPAFTPVAIPGLFIGCLVSNLMSGGLPLDVLFGSLATLFGACGTYLLRKWKWAVPVPPILSNALPIPFVLAYVYHIHGVVPYFMVTVGIGQIISCGILGIIVYNILAKYRNVIFK